MEERPAFLIKIFKLLKCHCCLEKKAINVINKNQFFFYNSMAKQYSKYFVFSCYVRSKIVVLTFMV